jgi:hypothetical protein
MRLPGIKELPIVFRCGALAALVPIMIKLLPLPYVVSVLQRRSKSRTYFFKPDELARIAAAVVRLGPRFGVGECLVRSLVLYNILRNSAYEPVLVIGGKICNGQLDGHCWIEVDGKSVCEVNDPRKTFSPICTLT